MSYRQRIAIFVCLVLGAGFTVASCGESATPGRPVTELPPHELPAWPELSQAQRDEAARLGVPVKFENEFGMRFVLIPAGTFQMGSPPREEGRSQDETVHEVELTRPYYMQVTEVTNWAFRRFRPEHDVRATRRGHTLNGDRQPVSIVSWTDATEFAYWVSRATGNRRYRLPTEAEWEYACRAGTGTRFSWGESEAEAHRYANAYDEATKADSFAPEVELQTFPGDDGNRVTAIVGSYRPNAWGLYDMLGNVAELCHDWYAPYPEGRSVDPSGPLVRDDHVHRGGSWICGPDIVRCASRGKGFLGFRNDTVGFRLVSPLPEKGE